MSLSNPNAFVTEERLNEYHNTILPFLGGMPDILANKFARGDMYSTDEKMIGQWIDGKPLYQKTIDCGVLPNKTNKNISIGISESINVINMFGYAINSTSKEDIPLPYVHPSASILIDCRDIENAPYIFISSTANMSAFASYVTLQYTKTTDSSVEIGIDTDYSTTEKIIGTWIDGKPIWQKTFIATSCSAGYNYITHGLTNAKIISGWGVYMELNGEGNPLPMLGASPSSIDAPYSVILSHISGGRIEFLVGANRSGGDIYYTLQYTKNN